MFSSGSAEGATVCTDIVVNDDIILENGESFLVSLTPADAEVNIRSGAELGTVLITEDPNDDVEVGVEQLTYLVNEASQDGLVVCAELVVGVLERSVIVEVSSVNGTATFGDFILLMTALTFTSGSSMGDTECLSIEIRNDDILEADETFFVELFSFDGDVVRIGNNIATVTITEDINDEIEIGFEDFIYEVNEADGSVTVCAVVSHGTLERSVEVLLVTVDGSATSTDYTSLSVGLTFSEEVNRICREIVLVNDAILESEESFSASLTPIDGDVVSITADSSVATVLVIEDITDGVEVGFHQTSYTANEAAAISTVCVELTAGDLERNVTVIVQTQNSTASSSDYIEQTSQLTFISGSSVDCQLCVEIELQNDNILENDEAFFVTLTTDNPDIVNISANSSSAIVIIFEDPNDGIEIGIEQPAYTVTEATDTVVQVCSRMNAGTLERNITATLRTLNGTAISGSIAGDFQPQDVQLQFTSGATVGHTVCRDIEIFDDNVLEADESFTVSLAANTASIVAITPRAMNASVFIIEDATDNIVVGLEEEAYTGTEALSQEIDVCVRISVGMLERSVTVTISTMNGTAISRETFGDFVALDEQLTFTSGSGIGSALCTTVSLIDDDILESEEDFNILLLTSDSNVVDIVPGATVATITIFEDPGDGVEIGLDQTDYTVNEASGTVTVCARLNAGALERNVSVTMSTVDGTASSNGMPEDFILQPVQLTFTSGSQVTDVTCGDISLVNDNILEDEENFTVALNSDISVVIITSGAASATVTITEDTSDTIVIGLEATLYSVQEGDGSLSICAVLYSGILERNVQVFLTTTDGTATSTVPSDFNLPMPELTFTSGSTMDSMTCTDIVVVNDVILEAEESFTVTISTVNTNAANISITSATVVITEDSSDRVEVGLQQQLYIVNEATGLVMVCALLNSGILEKDVAISLATRDGTATSTAPADYVTVDEEHTFSSGSRVGEQECITIEIINDTITEDSEQFVVALTPVDRGITLERDIATVMISDTESGFQIGLEQNSVYTVNEGTDAQVAICAVVFAGQLERVVRVAFNTSEGTATSADFSHGEVQATFTSGSVVGDSVCVDIGLTNDTILEDDENFTVMLSAIDSDIAAIVPNFMSAEVIIEEDSGDGIIVGVEQLLYTVQESDNSQETVCVVMRNGTLERNVRIALHTVEDTADMNDYIPISVELTFTSGSSAVARDVVCTDIAVRNDASVENNEVFLVQLNAVDSDVVQVAPNQSSAAITLIEDSTDNVEICFENTLYTVNETEANLPVCVQIVDGFLERPVAVTLSTQTDTATSGDIMEVSMLMTFASGDSTGSRICTQIGIVNDDILEHDETFTLLLMAVDEVAIVASGCSSATVVIVEDASDGVVINLDLSSNEVIEGVNPSVQACAVLSNGTLEIDISVRLSTVDGTATSTEPSDFNRTMSQLTFTAPNRSRSRLCVEIQLVNDNILESEESFMVLLEAIEIEGDVSSISTSTATVVITEDSNDGVEIAMEQQTYTVNEATNATATVCAALTLGTLERDVTVLLSSQDGTATSTVPSDFTEAQHLLVFPSGDSGSQCVDVVLVNDDILENEEVFSVVLTAVDVDVVNISATAPSAAVIVTEDVNDSVEVGFEQTEYTVNEAATSGLSVCIELTSGMLERNVSVILNTVDGTATSIVPTDYSSHMVELTFSSGDVAGSMVCTNIQLTNDDILEADESFAILVIPTEPGVLSISSDRATANITITEDTNDGVELRLQQPVYTVNEATPSVSVCVELNSGILERDVTVDINALSGSATVPGDVNTTSQSVTFTSGMSVGALQCANFLIHNDDILENNEMFSVSLDAIDSSVVSATSQGATATVVITEDSTDSVEIGIQQQSYTVDEDAGIIPVCAVLSQGTLERVVSVRLFTEEGTATSSAPADFLSASSTRTFDSQIDRQCVDIQIRNDNILESEEQFTVSLNAIDTEINIMDGAGSATVIIREDNNDGVEVRLVVATTTVTEGSDDSVSVCIRISEGILERDVTVRLLTEDGTASLSAGDFTLPDNSIVTFQSGSSSIRDSEQCRQIELENDEIPEETETFQVLIAATVRDRNVVQISDASSTTVTIIEDSNDEVVAFCAAESTDSPLYGMYEWPDTTTRGGNNVVELQCIFGNGTVARMCMENEDRGEPGVWADPDFTDPDCLTITSFLIMQLRNVEVTAETVEELTTDLGDLVDDTIEEDQNTENLEVVANLLSSTASLLDNGTTITGQTTENIVRLIDGVQEWPEEVVQQQSSMIVQAFEAIATSLVEQEGFDNITVIEEETVLAAERAPLQELQTSGRTFTIGNDSAMDIRAEMEFADEAILQSNITASILLPSLIFNDTRFENGTDSSVVFTFYGDATLFPLANQSNVSVTGTETVVATSVIGAIVDGRTLFNLVEPITVLLQLNLPENSNLSTIRCVSYDFNALGDGIPDWTTFGCELLSVSSDDRVECHCNHLTNFASLVDIQSRVEDTSISEEANLALGVVSIIGAVLSIIGCTLVIITYLGFRKLRKHHTSKFHVQLCVAILCMMVVFVTGIDRTETFAGCVLVSALIQYFTLASVLWMAAEAWLMFIKLVLVFVQITTKLIVITSVICWAVPLPFVVIPLGISRNFMVSETFCFISNRIVFFVAFLGPIFAVILFNTGIFSVVIFILVKHAKKLRRHSNEPQYKETLQLLVSVFFISSIFGLAWLFGAFTIMEASIAFQALFVLFNAFQGFFLFLFFCLINREARSAWLECVGFDYRSRQRRNINRSTSSRRKKANSESSPTKISSFAQSSALPSDFRHSSASFASVSDVEVSEQHSKTILSKMRHPSATPSDLSADIIENPNVYELAKDGLNDTQEVQMELFQTRLEESSLSSDSSDSEHGLSPRRRVRFEDVAMAQIEDGQLITNVHAE